MNWWKWILLVVGTLAVMVAGALFSAAVIENSDVRFVVCAAYGWVCGMGAYVAWELMRE